MRKIIVAPLGPGAPEHLTLGALDAFEKAGKVILRTGRHGACGELDRRGIAYTTLDSLYEQCDDFDALNDLAAQTLWEAAGSGPVAYGVPDPAADETVRKLLSQADAQNTVTLLAGVSLAAPLMTALPGDQPPRVLPAADCPAAILVPAEPLLITELDTKLLAGEVKVWLLTLHDPGLEVLFFPPGEQARREPKKIPLEELDRQKAYDQTAAVFVLGVPMLKREQHDFFDLLEVMRTLRSPEGCPWDKEQTHESLRPYLLEEAYEAVAAIDEGDMDHVADELGDVLLQVVFHAEIARQHGEFDIKDITTAICRKMISRHAHIFGDVKCGTAQEVLISWDKQKKKERGLTTQADVLKDVPKHLPSLMRAGKVQQKAKQVGFDWDDPKDALKKVFEEAGEVQEELEKGNDPGEELGDLLFAAVNVARLCHKQPELLLSQAVEKFIRRFDRMEQAILADGKALEHLTLSEMDVYWEKGKRSEKKA